MTSWRRTATDPNECQSKTAKSATFSRLRLNSINAASRVVDESNSVIQTAIRSRDTAALLEFDDCCWPEFILELFDIWPVVPADGGPLLPPVDWAVGLGEGVDDTGDDIFMIIREKEV